MRESMFINPSKGYLKTWWAFLFWIC